MSNSGPETSMPNKLIFVNCVDSYVGQNLAKYLSRCAVGASSSAIEEDEEEHEGEEQEPPEPSPDEVYKIIGSLKDRNKSKPAFVKDIVLYNSIEMLYAELIMCDVIIYDISESPEQMEEAILVVAQLHADLEKFDKNRPKTFILICSLLTWARTKPLEGDEAEVPFTEDDFRRRKPHPSYKEQCNAEKTVLKFGKTNRSKLVTYVVATGLTYGVEEGILHYLFTAGWHNATELPCIGEGRNILPMIHIRDLAGVVQNLADNRPKSKYIVAVDDSHSSLREITKAVSRALTTGKVRFVREEEAVLDRERKQYEFDQLLMNLQMDAVSIKDMNIRWTSESGLVENIDRIVKEYKESRHLVPIKVVILGPPAAGKSTVAEQICQSYKLHHVRIKSVIEETIQKMQKAIASRSERKEVLDEEEEEEEEGEEEDEQDQISDYESLLESINESKERNNGRIEDQYVIQMFRDKLKSKPCQNQGFILDGFPKTIEQAKELFASDETESEAEGAEGYNKLFIPDLVICLEATDEFLRQRVLSLPENAVVGTHYTENGMTRCLAEYRALNSEGDDTVVTFFEELELQTEVIDVTKDSSVKMKDTAQKIMKLMGPARNYGASSEEDEESRSAETEARLKKEAEEKAEKERLEAEEAVNRKRRQDEWSKRLEEVKTEEREQLEVKATPLRNYLMRHVMPTLTKALIDCVKIRPEDAIDFIAEYMFTHNPQVD